MAGVNHLGPVISDNEEDEMADFIVYEEEVYGRGASLRQREFHDIFGHVEDLLAIRNMESRGNDTERTHEDQFNQSVLSEKYMTGKDDRIREIDVPERMQITQGSTGPPPKDHDNIAMEMEWIYNQLVSGVAPVFNIIATHIEVNELRDQISRFLELMHVQKLDVPFISMYRKDKILSLLKDPNERQVDNENDPSLKPTLKWHKVLWRIQNLDQKWLILQKRKSALQSYYNKCRVNDETRLNLSQRFFESITKSLKAADSEREVDDVESKFTLHFPAGEVVLDEGQFKRPKKKSHYSICSKAGLWEVASKFGYSSEQFGVQISLVKMRMDELEDAKETPEEMAFNYTCVMFETPQAVLKGARHMAAVEISCEPCVRRHVRGIFMDNAVVSTSPTADGNVAIDSFHQFAGVKWLQEKPLSRFDDAQWLLIQKAEEEKLLKVTIKLPETVLENLISDAKYYYLSDGGSKSAQLWNKQRKLILHDAFYILLLPLMENEARSLLTSRAKTWLIWEYGKRFWDKVSVAPYQRKENDVNSDEEAAAPRVMACCWGPGKSATTFVMLDSSGEILDTLHAGSFNLSGHSVNEQQRKKNDQLRVQKFMMGHQPHVVVLGASKSTRLKEDVDEITFKMVEDNLRHVGHKMDNLNIEYGDESLPHLNENFRTSVDQLPSREVTIRRAVALGHYLQNPVAVVATLCGPGREILSWKHHPLEYFLTPDEKYGMVEQIMVDVTNQVGLDINLASSHKWLFAPLQFISGLGPRKAASLQRSLVKAGAIFTRKELLTSHGLGKNVFRNAVGFLRVRHSGLASSSSQFIDLLDDTRIHPESYDLAQELAKYIYREYGNDDFLEIAIENVRDKPQLLRATHVHKFAKQKNLLNKKETLNDIRLELVKGFQERRRSYKKPSQDDEFYPTNKLHKGNILPCRIISIEKNPHRLLLTCRESKKRNRFQKHQIVDPYYKEPRILHSEQDKALKEKELSVKHFLPRMIVHHHFQNIRPDDAVEFLSRKDPGEIVFHPSSRGPSYLTLTLKVYDGVYANKDIFEVGKKNTDISLLQIGKILKIGEDTFDDLDEVMYSYVDPLVAHLKAMLNYRKFKTGNNKTEVDELLRIEKSENPMRIVYCFGICHEHPGAFILTYIRSSDPHHEYIDMLPKGFKFRKRMFEDIDCLVAYFQRHIDDDPHDSAPSIQLIS